MTSNFNAYIDGIGADKWRQLCLDRGELHAYARGEEFVKAGTFARYIGYVQTGTLKYVVFSESGTEHVVGLEFAGEFVADFPFSLYGERARASIIAESDCEIWRLGVEEVTEMMRTDPEMSQLVARSVVAVFGTVYDRYAALYTKSPQERYNDLISRHPDIFSLFSLRAIASFLNVTPTHLSRLRKNVE